MTIFLVVFFSNILNKRFHQNVDTIFCTRLLEFFIYFSWISSVTPFRTNLIAVLKICLYNTSSVSLCISRGCRYCSDPSWHNFSQLHISFRSNATPVFSRQPVPVGCEMFPKVLPHKSCYYPPQKKSQNDTDHISLTYSRKTSCNKSQNRWPQNSPKNGY